MQDLSVITEPFSKALLRPLPHASVSGGQDVPGQTSQAQSPLTALVEAGELKNLSRQQSHHGQSHH